jgi:hypothetical protein
VYPLTPDAPVCELFGVDVGVCGGDMREKVQANGAEFGIWGHGEQQITRTPKGRNDTFSGSGGTARRAVGRVSSVWRMCLGSPQKTCCRITRRG